jgi:hypothetical protein
MKDRDSRRHAAAGWSKELRGKLDHAAILFDRYANVLLRINSTRASQKREQADQEDPGSISL